MKSIRELETAISNANDAYYNNVESAQVEDSVYDSWKEQLLKIDPNNKLLLQIGADPLQCTNKTPLPYWMGSMDKKTDERSITRFLDKNDGPFVVSDKLDGVSALYVYRTDGPRLYTRGNGSVGQDITKTLMPLLRFPIMNSTKSFAFAIRGELIVSRLDFEDIIKQRVSANPRNMVSGIVNSKQPDPKLVKYVKFVAYAVFEPEMEMKEQLMFLQRHHFDTVAFSSFKSISFDQLGDLLIDRRKASAYEIDGLIVSTKNFERVEKGNPVNAFAFKTTIGQDFAIVTVEKIEWHISKDGLIKPVLVFPSVLLNGVEIHRCTGFNAKYVVSNRLGVGAQIKLIRAGLVIPHCESVVKESTSGRADLPDSSFEWTITGVDIRMVESSPELKLRVLQHFCEKMSIVGLGPAVVKKLFDGRIDNPQKVVSVTEDELCKLPGFKDASAAKLVNAIATAISIARNKCLVYMVASNSFGQGFGENKLSLFIGAFPEVANPNSDYLPSMREMLSINGISTITAEAFLTGLGGWRKFMRKNKLVCTNVTERESRVGSRVENQSMSKYSGKYVVFTGIRDKELERQLVQVGATIQSGVTKDTNFLVTKDDMGKSTGKIEKAMEYGVTVLNISQFRK